LHERDWPRVQRALEVRLQTGLPISAQKETRQNRPSFAARIHPIALLPPRAELNRLINQRVDLHFEAGLVEEVKSLLGKGVSADSKALEAHGYRRVVEYLRGLRDLPSAVEQTKLDVRRYAKRQLTWFRHEPGVTWFEGFGSDEKVLEQVFSYVQAISEHTVTTPAMKP
jgi:tRNA dimethylallyltransferase